MAPPTLFRGALSGSRQSPASVHAGRWRSLGSQGESPSRARTWDSSEWKLLPIPSPIPGGGEVLLLTQAAKG